jgi:hypothetical protein
MRSGLAKVKADILRTTGARGHGVGSFYDGKNKELLVLRPDRPNIVVDS